MRCPRCKGRLLYEEHVNGTYTYPIVDGKVDWEDHEFEGECYGHTIRCAHCEFHQSIEITNEILDRSLK